MAAAPARRIVRPAKGQSQEVLGSVHMSKRKSSDSGGEDLLNIEQAAKLLNVSKASLRRWTDAGRISCYRVGAQRARRFRREDLLAFIGGPADKSARGRAGVETTEARHSSVNRARLGGLELKYTHHICALYGRPAGRLKLAVPLLDEGLQVGDVCFLIGTEAARGQILEALQRSCPNVDAALERGQLVLPELRHGKDRMLDALEEMFLAATSSGNRKLRLVGDMHWALATGWDLTELYQYELEYNNTLGHRFPVISLCQYDVDAFSGRAVLDALKSHEDTYQYPIGHFCL